MSFEVLYLRRPKIEYVSPPVCEGIFSSTGSTVIVLEPFGVRSRVTGLVLESDGHGGFRLSWNNYPGALCYNIYFSVDGNNYIIIAECVGDTEFPVSNSGFYRVSAITPEGESDLSDAVIFPIGPIPPSPCDPFIDETGLDDFGNGGTRYDVSSDGTVVGYKTVSGNPRPWYYHNRTNSDIRSERDSGTIQASQTLDIVTSDAPFFVPSDLNKFLKFDSGGNARKIVMYLSSTGVQVDVSDTIASSEFTVYGQTLGGDFGIAFVDNGSGQIAGQETDPASNFRNFWFNRNTGEIRDLGDGNLLSPIDLNENGFFLYTDGTTGTAKGFVYNPNTQMSTDIGTLSDAVNSKRINNSLAVVGQYRLLDVPFDRFHAFKWQSGVMTDIHPAAAGPSASNDSQGEFITNSGFIVGEFQQTPVVFLRERVFYNDGGASVSIGSFSLDGDIIANDVNESKIIVGGGEIAGSGSDVHPFKFTIAGGLVDLLPPAGYTSFFAKSINSAGIIVGDGTNDGGATTDGFIYIAGVWHDLRNYLPAASGWTRLFTATTITDNNEVVGTGLHNGDFKTYFFKLCL